MGTLHHLLLSFLRFAVSFFAIVARRVSLDALLHLWRRVLVDDRGGWHQRCCRRSIWRYCLLSLPTQFYFEHMRCSILRTLQHSDNLSCAVGMTGDVGTSKQALGGAGLRRHAGSNWVDVVSWVRDEDGNVFYSSKGSTSLRPTSPNSTVLIQTKRCRCCHLLHSSSSHHSHHFLSLAHLFYFGIQNKGGIQKANNSFLRVRSRNEPRVSQIRSSPGADRLDKPQGRCTGCRCCRC
jgi:hypothetical protein